MTDEWKGKTVSYYTMDSTILQHLIPSREIDSIAHSPIYGALFFLFSKRFLFRPYLLESILILGRRLFRPSFPEGTHIFLLKNCSARLSQAARGFRKEGLGDFKYQSHPISYKKPKPGLASRLY